MIWRHRGIIAWAVVSVINAALFAGIVADISKTNKTARTAQQAVRQTAINRRSAIREFNEKDRRLCRVTTTLLNLQVKSTRAAVPLFRPLFAGNPQGFEKAVKDARLRLAKLRRVRNALDCGSSVRAR